MPGYVYFPALYGHADTFFFATWAVAALALLVSILRGGLIQVLLALAPFSLFGVVALATSFLAEDHDRALRFVGYWFLVAASGASIASLGRWQTLHLAVTTFFALILAASLVTSFVATDLGPGIHNSGLFEQKQVQGWFSTLTAILFMALESSLPVRLAGVLLGLVGCILSNSQSAAVLVVAIPALYVGADRLFRYVRVRPLIRVGAFLMIIVAAWIVVLAALPVFTALLGRDATFETRTLMWPEYMKYAGGHILAGLGPGMLSGSWINFAVWSEDKTFYYSTHNTYLTVLGETGIFGLCTYVLTLVCFVAVRPFGRGERYEKQRSSVMVSAGVALQLVIGGFIEPTIGFFPTQIALSTFILVLASAAPAKRKRRHRRRRSPLSSPDEVEPDSLASSS